MATPTLVTASGRPTVYYPLSTPWPQAIGCSAQFYRQLDAGTVLAWDPYFGKDIDDSAASCFPPEVTSWWFQTLSQTTSIALGPTFVCPEAYTAAQTRLEDGGLQHVYCCPKDYTFHVPQPTLPVFPSQCLSEVTAGETIFYQSLTASGGKQTHFATGTVVKTGTLTVWAVPINGYNFPTSSTSVSNPGITIPPTTQTITQNLPASTNTEVPRGNGDESSGAPLTLTVGVSVGVVLGVLVLLGGVFMLWRRRRRARKAGSPRELEATTVYHVEPINFEGRKFELPAQPVVERKYELYGDDIQTQPTTVHEMPGSREKG
ncbi:uncharacterized protein CLUP02_06578 [Colletotrichum lupini]|uniref:LPXTG-domain-containing protein n=1 Tax=Colletotrichum lupini TaxID=145971 RepID=A0A9Q8SR67_9PEZI|nr:uncharacterized protein CLUP02_06578 [Colletotrichum lupini]KAK1705146.1 hypothetical protein BDP67DRAFT_532127 [Colletotrichum lupini]UQC81092.1 hypothetical protein CLUP02_06578 [Colletotrichum lupini]